MAWAFSNSEFGHHVSQIRFHGDFTNGQFLATSTLGKPWARRMKNSRSRSVSWDILADVDAFLSDWAANLLMSRQVTVGFSQASPAATARIAVVISMGGIFEAMPLSEGVDLGK
jgi:hypothetical protein